MRGDVQSDVISSSSVTWRTFSRYVIQYVIVVCEIKSFNCALFLYFLCFLLDSSAPDMAKKDLTSSRFSPPKKPLVRPKQLKSKISFHKPFNSTNYSSYRVELDNHRQWDNMYLIAFNNDLIPREWFLSLNNLPTVVCCRWLDHLDDKSNNSSIETCRSVIDTNISPVEAQKYTIDLPIVVEPVEAQNKNQIWFSKLWKRPPTSDH